MRLVLAALLLGGCSFPTPSDGFACSNNDQCSNGRVCEQGFCIRTTEIANDAAVTMDADAPIDADPFEAIAAMCTLKGYTVDAATGGYYRISAVAKKWTDAQAECKADVTDATHLIVLSNAAEVTFVSSHLGWVGLSDIATEGTFVNVTGETPDERPFANGQPDNGGGNENCVQMNNPGKLDDDQCGNTHKFVCECDGQASTP